MSRDDTDYITSLLVIPSANLRFFLASLFIRRARTKFRVGEEARVCCRVEYLSSIGL